MYNALAIVEHAITLIDDTRGGGENALFRRIDRTENSLEVEHA